MARNISPKVNQKKMLSLHNNESTQYTVMCFTDIYFVSANIHSNIVSLHAVLCSSHCTTQQQISSD